VKCKETGKECHSRGEAAAHLLHLVEKNGYNGGIYPCVYCNKYHVGRLKKRAHVNKYAKILRV